MVCLSQVKPPGVACAARSAGARGTFAFLRRADRLRMTDPVGLQRQAQVVGSFTAGAMV